MFAISTKSSLITDHVFPRRPFVSELLTKYWWQPCLPTALLAFLLLHCTHWHYKSHTLSVMHNNQLPNSEGYYKRTELIFEYMF